jgi:aspartate aminotransferase
MRFSEKVQEIEISGIRRIFEGAGPGSINMGLGQPDYDTPQHIKDAAIRAIRDGKTGYTVNAGIPELRTAICEKLQRENALSYDPAQIIVTAGASEAIHIAVQALVNPGDRVLVPDPGFVSYSALATIAGARVEGLPLTSTLHIDVDAAMERMEGARLLFMNSPGNPTGAVESPESICALVECAEDHGVTVISDEVYEHFTYGKPHVSAACYGENVITVNAASKTYAMTGWRIGYLAADESVIGQCIKVHQYCQACATSIAQYAAVAAYTGDQSSVGVMRREYQARRDLLYEGLTRLGFQFPLPEGAVYTFVPLGRDLTERILKKGVIIVPGDSFGRNAREYARLTYAISRENIGEALMRIAAAMGE